MYLLETLCKFSHNGIVRRMETRIHQRLCLRLVGHSTIKQSFDQSMDFRPCRYREMLYMVMVSRIIQHIDTIICEGSRSILCQASKQAMIRHRPIAIAMNSLVACNG